MFVVVDGFLLEHPDSPHKDVMAWFGGLSIS